MILGIVIANTKSFYPHPNSLIVNIKIVNAYTRTPLLRHVSTPSRKPLIHYFLVLILLREIILFFLIDEYYSILQAGFYAMTLRNSKCLLLEIKFRKLHIFSHKKNTDDYIEAYIRSHLFLWHFLWLISLTLTLGEM